MAYLALSKVDLGGKVERQKCMHACMGGSGQQGGKLSQDGKLSQGRPGRKCMHVWIWAARWKANARWKAIARLKAIARCTQVRQVEPGPSSWAAMVGSLSKRGSAGHEGLSPSKPPTEIYL